MAKDNCDPTDNYRGSSRDYPKSPEAGYNPGKSINISAGDLMAKDMSSGVSEKKRPPQKI